jgi:hypothetical protein
MIIDYSQYQNSISKNLDLNPDYWFFKNDQNYTPILEHVTFEFGQKYISEIENRFKDLYTENMEFIKNIIIENDRYGKPIKYNYGFIECSPTNFRYLLHSFIILNYIKNKSLNNIDFIEIGGGYGGLCLYVYKMSKIFNISINSYTIYDLKEPCLLQKKYLLLHNININIEYSIENTNNIKKNSFLISNYAFSEISNDLQKKYIENVIDPFCENGFLVWNHIDFYEFVKNKKYIVENEYPGTGYFTGNYYVYFS